MSPRFWFGAALALYLAWTGALALLAPGLVYPFARTPFRDPAFAFRDVAADGLTLPVAVAPGDPERPVIVFFMGNYGARDGFSGLLDPLVRAGFGVIAMPYRGGEGLGGRPSEAALKADALAVVDAIAGMPGVQGRPLHMLGYSLGAGLALHVAAERPAAVASIALIAPFDRLCAVAARRTLTPACLIPGVPRWDNLASVPRIAAPVFLAHGLDDRLIPPRHAARLGAALAGAGAPLELHALPGAGHNDIGIDRRLAAALQAWAGGGWRAARPADPGAVRAALAAR